MKRSLNLVAELLTNNEGDYLTLDWSALRYKHTAGIRAALVKNYEPATVNRVLCALRRVLKEALRLELSVSDRSSFPYWTTIDLAISSGREVQ